MSLLQTVPDVKTSKKVASSLFTTSVVLSYSGTHWLMSPPGLRCCRTSEKYSFVYSALAAPFTQAGWIGSDVDDVELLFEVVRM